MFKIALIGRPNVGKSTLFNRLVGRRLAIVDDTPGVTRDRRKAVATLGDLSFELIDTAGIDSAKSGTFESEIQAQTEKAIAESDLVLFIVDARAGVMPLDEDFAQVVRKSQKPILLIANKAEGKVQGLDEFYRLGLGDFIPLSAAHGDGTADLHNYIFAEVKRQRGEDFQQDDGERAIKVCIVGRPNAGKSTLMNALLNEDRVVTSPIAGTTRDAISVDFTYKGHPIQLVDTAGLRRKSRIYETIETMSVQNTLQTIRFAEVVIVMLDAGQSLEKQDLTILRMIEDEGRACVIAINKWDKVQNGSFFLNEFTNRLEQTLNQFEGIYHVPISALHKRHLDKLMDAALETYALWNQRLPTAKLNLWLKDMLETHEPPMIEGKRLKIKYMTQIKSRPPTFALFVNRSKGVPESYLRYLRNGLRRDFGLRAVPIRFQLRAGKNPYAEGDE